MAISYPLSIPAALHVAKISITGKSVVSMASSPFTLQQQVYAHQGQCWMAEISCPKMERTNAEQVVGFLLALNGRQGTFYLGDSAYRTPRGSIAGSATCNGAQTIRSTTLTLTGHTGTLAVGDWLSISTNLYKVVQVNSAGSVDVFPALRAAYANGTAITYSTPLGLFRLASSEVKWDIDEVKIYGVSFAAMEVLP